MYGSGWGNKLEEIGWRRVINSQEFRFLFWVRLVLLCTRISLSSGKVNHFHSIFLTFAMLVMFFKKVVFYYFAEVRIVAKLQEFLEVASFILFYNI